MIGILLSPFFTNLFNYEPEKYKKAVTELFKKVMTETEIEQVEQDLSSFPLHLQPGKTPIFGNTVANYTNQRGAELLDKLPKEEREKFSKQFGAWRLTDAFLSQALHEYEAFINALTPQQLLEHKQAVEASGYGREYYVTNRWRQKNEKGEIPEPKRDANHNTIVEPHPKLPRKKNSGITKLIIKFANILDARGHYNKATKMDKVINTFIQKNSIPT